MAEAAPAPALRRKASMSQVDMTKYRRAFDVHDLTHSGYILAEDLLKVSQKLGYRISDDKCQEIISSNGLEESSKIYFPQFLELIPKNSHQISNDEHRVAELREKFQRYDKQQAGYVSLSDATWALQMELKVAPQTALRLLNQFIKLDYNQFCGFYEKIQQKKLEVYEMFGRYDADKDGLISVEEAHQVLHKELGFSEQRSQDMVKKFDLNHDGMVSYIEFAEFYLAVEERKSKVREMFRRFDTTGQGYVTFEQAQNVLEDMLGFSSVKCKKTIEAYDKNKDGKIDYEEFLEFYTMMEEERNRLVEEFSRFNVDGDGKVALDSVKVMLKNQGCSDNMIQQLMDEHHQGNNNNTTINFEEFKRFLNFS